MGLFEILMGGGQKRQEYEDFTRRYEQGPPWEGYSDEEVMERYGEVAHEVAPADYETAVRDALSRLSPAERAEFARELQERARGRGGTLPAPGPGGGGGLDELARSVRELHEQPGRLREVMTGPSGGGSVGWPGGSSAGPAGIPPGGGSIFSSPLAKAAIAGITTMLLRRLLAPR